jgi:hypothetical protein
MPKMNECDFLLTRHGGLVICTPMQAEARQWLAEHAAAEPWQYYAGGLVVEPRYAADLVAGMEAEDFICQWEE